MKKLVVIAAAAFACVAAIGQAQTSVGDPPVRSASVPTQRIGDLVVRGSITPTWYVPNESAGAIMAATSPSNIPPVPTRAGTAPEVQAPLRLNSREWRERIEFLEGQIQTKQRELSEAKASEILAIHSEQRDAEEQIKRAQALVEQLRAKAVASSDLPPVVVKAAPPATMAPTATVKTAEPVTPVNTSTVATVEVTPSAPAALAPVQAVQVFQLRRDDRTIASALTRWAEEARYTLLWETDDKPASFDAKYSMSFPDAVHQVVQSLNAVGVDVRMCNYTNQVVRIVPKDIGCVFATSAKKN